MKNNNYEKYKLIAMAIVEIRKEKNLTQRELAHLLGVSLSYISKIEAPNTEKTFSLEIIFDIADALDVSVKEMFKYLS